MEPQESLDLPDLRREGWKYKIVSTPASEGCRVGPPTETTWDGMREHEFSERHHSFTRTELLNVLKLFLRTGIRQQMCQIFNDYRVVPYIINQNLGATFFHSVL